MPQGAIVPVKVVDLDTGAGTDNVSLVGVALPASGGAVVGGTATNPLRTDPTGTTTQPVSGAFFQATQPVSGTFWQATQPISVADGSDSAIGAKADAEASTDTGTFSFIALFKHALTKLATISGYLQTLAGIVTSSVASVAIAEKTLVFTTGTISSSGDNTILAAPGSLQNKILFLQIQNESSTATTVIVKFGSTAKARVLCQNQGDGMQFTAPPGRNWPAGTTTLIALNLSGANSVGYTLVTCNEA